MEGADVFFRQLFEIPENKKCVDCGKQRYNFLLKKHIYIYI